MLKVEPVNVIRRKVLLLIHTYYTLETMTAHCVIRLERAIGK